MNDFKEIMKLSVKNSECLCMEYDIVQHALYDTDGDNGLANFSVCYDNDYNLEYVSIHPYGSIRTGSEIYVLKKDDSGVLLSSETYANFKPATIFEEEFFKVFENYFKTSVESWRM